MTYHIYEYEKSQFLQQGDIFDAGGIRQLLKGHQDYFAHANHFTHYILLTQSCDLIPAQGVADYLTIAAVRPFSQIFGRRHLENVKSKEDTARLLGEIYLHNNTRRGLFYLPYSQSIREESAADLRVTLSLHRMHYYDLMASRVHGLVDLYRAKLGQMYAHLFYRVATPDWSQLFPGQDRSSFCESRVKDLAIRDQESYQALVDTIGNNCCVTNCNRPASTYRWIQDLVDNKLIAREHLLCSEHAREFDLDVLNSKPKRGK